MCKMSRKCKSASSTPVEDSVFELRTRMARMLSIVEITSQKNNMVSEYRLSRYVSIAFRAKENLRETKREREFNGLQLRPSMRDNIDDL